MNPFPQSPVPMPTVGVGSDPIATKATQASPDASTQASTIHEMLDQLQQQKELLRTTIEHLQLMVRERDEYIASLLHHTQNTVQG